MRGKRLEIARLRTSYKVVSKGNLSKCFQVAFEGRLALWLSGVAQLTATCPGPQYLEEFQLQSSGFTRLWTDNAIYFIKQQTRCVTGDLGVTQPGSSTAYQPGGFRHYLCL